MLTIIHVILALINAILRIVAIALLKGASIAASALVVLLIVIGLLSVSGAGAFRFLRRKRDT